MKILIIRFTPFGDIVHASPLLRGLRKTLPTAEIHFLTSEDNRGAVEFNPYINKLQVLAFSDELVRQELRTEDYDLIIDLQGDSKTTMIIGPLHKKVLSVNDLTLTQRLLNKLGTSSGTKRNNVDRYFKTAHSLDVENDGAGLEYYISKQDETNKEDIPASHYAGYIAFSIKSEFLTASWRIEQWKELCTQLDHPIILIGGKKEAPNARIVATSDEIKIYNACGKFSLNETADLIRKSKMLVTNTTDYFQVAAAFKKPVLSIGENISSFPYYGEKFLSERSTRPYENLQAGKTSIADALTAIKKRL